MDHVRHVKIETPSIWSISVVSEFNEVFQNDLPCNTLDRYTDFFIDLQPDNRPISIPLYRMDLEEFRELKARIQELLDKGFFHPSASPWGALVLFVKNIDDSIRMCINSR